jgi:disulfide oxidoreductase YuzD
MRDTHKTVIWVILVLGFLCASSVAGQEVETERDLREWIEARLDRRFSGLPAGMGVIVEYTHTRTAWRSARQIEDDWEEIRKYPDHPERYHVQYMRRLSREPEVSECLVAYSDHGRFWRYDRRYVSGSVIDGEWRRAGGRSEKRWMDGGGVLTIVHAGVPFPSYRHVGLSLDDARGLLLSLLNGALGRLRSGAVSESVARDVDVWQAVLQWDEGRSRTVIKGDIGDRGEPRVRTIAELDSEDGSESQPRFRLERYQYDGAYELTYPTRLIEDRGDGIRELYTLDSFRIVKTSQVRDLGGVPTAAEGVRVEDFAKGVDSPAWDSDALGPSIVWLREGDRDVYRIQDSGGRVVSSSRSGTGDMDADRSDGDVIEGGRVEDGHGQGRRRTAAVIAVVFVVVGAPVLVYWVRRNA